MNRVSEIVLNHCRCYIYVVLLTVITSKAQNSDQRAYITKYFNENSGLGPYSFGFETSNGIKFDQTGELRNYENMEILVVTGSYSYIGPDGVTYTVHYTADENGFRPRPAVGRPEAPAISPPVVVSYGLEGGGGYSASGGYSGGGGGAPKPGTKTGISCTTIATLCGGGIG